MPVIRQATPADVPAIAAIYNEAVLTSTATFDIEPRSLEERMSWLRDRGERHPVLVAEVDGEVVAFAALSRWSTRAAYDDTAETALYVRSSHRNRGIGRQLYGALIASARLHRFHSLIARVTSESEASLRLHREAGFETAGTLREVGCKFGRLLDVQILQKMLDC